MASRFVPRLAEGGTRLFGTGHSPAGRTAASPRFTLTIARLAANRPPGTLFASTHVSGERLAARRSRAVYGSDSEPRSYNEKPSARTARLTGERQPQERFSSHGVFLEIDSAGGPAGRHLRR